MRRTWGAPVEGLPEVDLLHGAGEEGGEGIPVFPPGHVGQRVGAIELHDPAFHPYLLVSAVPGIDGAKYVHGWMISSAHQM